MLKASLKKIKSAPKPAILFAVGLAIFVIGCILIISMQHASTTGLRTLHVSRNTYQLEEATTPAAQQQGLGGRVTMDANRGMLFTFIGDDQRCFWMQDMHFPLDIIWASSAKKVTYIERNLSPATYPQQYCHPGEYVIELNAGEAAKSNLHTGQTLEF